MNDEKYPDFLNEISNYLLGIANYSKLYVDNIITTIMQFLNFMNTYKFEGKYDSLNKIYNENILKIDKLKNMVNQLQDKLKEKKNSKN